MGPKVYFASFEALVKSTLRTGLAGLMGPVPPNFLSPAAAGEFASWISWIAAFEDPISNIFFGGEGRAVIGRSSSFRRPSFGAVSFWYSGEMENVDWIRRRRSESVEVVGRVKVCDFPEWVTRMECASSSGIAVGWGSMLRRFGSEKRECDRDIDARKMVDGEV